MDYKHASWFTDYHKRKSRCYRDKKKREKEGERKEEVKFEK